MKFSHKIKNVWKRLKKCQKRWTAVFLETIFSRFCINCGKEGKYICDDCSLFVSEAKFICPSCDKPSYFGDKHQWCNDPEEMLGLINIWDYEGIIKKIFYHIKEDGTFHILEELIERIILLIENDPTRFSPFLSFMNQEETYITFVPIHKKKKKKRGFDQSEILARHFANIFNKKYVVLLERIKSTKSQIEIKGKESRIKNIKDAFVFLKPKENIKQVVIINDVWESGATMRECVKILKENKIENIWGFVLARV